MMGMTTRAMVLAAAAVLTIGTASAGNIAARFGNTVVATAPDGTTTKFYYNENNTFDVKIGQAGQPDVNSKGKWRVDGANVCITSETAFGPFEANKERCVPLNGDKVGDTWQAQSLDAAGKPVTVNVTIVAGR